MEKRLKVLVLIKPFWIYPKHQPKIDMIQALENYAEVYYWYENGHIKTILQELNIEPDFIFQYDIAWNYGLAPKIEGLSEIDIPFGCFVIDLHWNPKSRMQYFEKNNVDVIFSVSKHPFLQLFPQYGQQLCWLPWAINPEVMKDWGMKKDIDSLLMGLVYVTGETRGKFALPRKIPPEGRYAFRDAVFMRMKEEPGFVLHPHPGHRVKESKRLIVKEDYGKELNRSKIFYTCGSRNEAGAPAVLKFFEAPACKTLLLAETNKDMQDLGFIDGENYIACTIDNFYEKTQYYLTHEEERKRIAENGYHFVHNHHTNNHRAQQMVQVMEDCLGR